MSQCHCGQSRSFADCCFPIIQGKKSAKTAEDLMRSRYSAYVTNSMDYLNETVIGQAKQSRGNYDTSIQWQKLDICRVLDGQPSDKNGVVEFKAFYKTAEGNLGVVWEESTFVNHNGQWFYESGIHLNE